MYDIEFTVAIELQKMGFPKSIGVLFYGVVKQEFTDGWTGASRQSRFCSFMIFQTECPQLFQPQY